MRSVLAIFRKDVAHLWPQIALFLVLLPVSSVIDTGAALTAGDQEALLGVVALIAAWYLMACAILQEPLAGGRQYWLTRPVSARQLFAAKALFVFLFILLPVLVTQVAVLRMLGLSPRIHFNSLAWRQLFILAQVFLPAAALFSAGRSFTHVFLLALAAVAVIMVPRGIFPDVFVLGLDAPAWFGPVFRETLLAMTAAAALFAFYSRLDPRLSWGLLAALAAVGLLVTQLVWEDPPLGLAAISLETPPPRPRLPRPGRAQLPLRVPGLTSDAGSLVGPVRVTLVGTNRVSQEVPLDGLKEGRPRVNLNVPEREMQRTVRITGSLYFTLYQRLDAQDVYEVFPRVVVPDAGVCARSMIEGGQFRTVCLLPSLRVGIERSATGAGFLVPPGITDLPGSFAGAFLPVDRFESRVAELNKSLAAVKTVARVHGVFDFPAVRLADYPEPE